jgi:hypothetical protein
MDAVLSPPSHGTCDEAELGSDELGTSEHSMCVISTYPIDIFSSLMSVWEDFVARTGDCPLLCRAATRQIC